MASDMHVAPRIVVQCCPLLSIVVTFWRNPRDTKTRCCFYKNAPKNLKVRGDLPILSSLSIDFNILNERIFPKILRYGSKIREASRFPLGILKSRWTS